MRVEPAARLPVLDEALRPGLWAGRVTRDPALTMPRNGRVRRWAYAAAGEGGTVVGAAIVDLGFASTAFAFLHHDAATWTWKHTSPLGRGTHVARHTGESSTHAGGRGRVVVGGHGSLRLDVPMRDGPRVRVRVDAGTPVGETPAVLQTTTAGGGWNVTEKAAGYRVHGVLDLGGIEVPLGLAAGWRDWTCGRQDRRTVWRWAAGAGRAASGARVGLNLSTGMNDLEAGENVVWWDGVPHRLDLDELTPVAAVADDWRLAGPGWSLAFATAGVRAADENWRLVRSSYTQPIGVFSRTLPGPDGLPIDVELVGVTEDHLAVW